MTAEQDGPQGSIAAFASHSHFAAAQRIATALSQSSMVPKDYQNSVPNCLVALELANRTGASVLAVMQNTYIIQGRPSWAATFLIGSINTSGRFSSLRFETRGSEDPKDKKFACRAYAVDKASGDRLDGEWITWDMADGEGWSKKQGSKWLTMPGQMFRYRAASFWCRAYAPEISLGMRTAEEEVDMLPPMPAVGETPSGGAQALQRVIDASAAPTMPPTAPTVPSVPEKPARTDGRLL